MNNGIHIKKYLYLDNDLYYVNTSGIWNDIKLYGVYLILYQCICILSYFIPY
jgi:hypothetical protein